MKRITLILMGMFLMSCGSDGGDSPGGLGPEDTPTPIPKEQEQTLDTRCRFLNGDVSIKNQIRISTDINKSETWSPQCARKYIITKTSMISPGVTIQVLPGTVIEIYPNQRLEVAGSFLLRPAQTPEERIKIMGGVGYDRAGVLSYLGGRHSIEKVLFNRMEVAIEVRSGNLEINDVEIKQAAYGIYNMNGRVQVSKAQFKQINVGVYSEQITNIDNSVFDGRTNSRRPFMTGAAGNTNVYRSTFIRQKVAIASSGQFMGNTIRRCQKAVELVRGMDLYGNTFKANSSVFHVPREARPGKYKITENNFLDPKPNHVYVGEKKVTLDLRGNFWGNMNAEDVEETIIHHKDNNKNGKVLVKPMARRKFIY